MQSTEKIRRETLLCFRKVLVTKNFMHKRRVVSRFSVEYFLLHSSEKHRMGTLLCFTTFRVSKTKILCIRRGVSTIFRRILFVSQYRKNKLIWYQIFSFLCIRGGGGVSRCSVVIIKLNNLGKGWDSKPVVLHTVPWERSAILTDVSEIIKAADTKDLNSDLTLQNLVVLPTVPRKRLEILTDVSEIIKVSDTQDLNPDLTLQKTVVLPSVPCKQLEFLTNVRSSIGRGV